MHKHGSNSSSKPKNIVAFPMSSRHGEVAHSKAHKHNKKLHRTQDPPIPVTEPRIFSGSVLPKSQELLVPRQSSIPSPGPSVECMPLTLRRLKSAPGSHELLVLHEVTLPCLPVHLPHKRPCSSALYLLTSGHVPEHIPATHSDPLVLTAPPFEQGSDSSVSEDSDGAHDLPLTFCRHECPKAPMARWQYPPFPQHRSYWYPTPWGPLQQPQDPPSCPYWGHSPNIYLLNLPDLPKRSPSSSRCLDLGLEDALVSPDPLDPE